MGKFKYQKWLDGLNMPCPPGGYEERETIAFRWVFDNIEDNENFKPQFLKNPDRFQRTPHEVKCRAIGLSMYDSEENALVSFKRVVERTKIKSSKIGTHLAAGKIDKPGGLSSQPEPSGHFTFHPYERAELGKQFEIIGKL